MNSSDAPFVLIVAPSGRALAAAARRAGYRPLVVDFFDDLDTETWAAATSKVDVADGGFEAADLIARVDALATGRLPIGLVYGGGFEDRPELIAALAARFMLYGNRPEVVAAVKDPSQLAQLCASLAIPHPEIRFATPPDPAHWLIKRAGSGGGLHVAPALSKTAEPGDYYQRRLKGRSISALLLCDGRQAQCLGLSAQWTAGSFDKPFRFGGACRPAEIAPPIAEELAAAAKAIATAAQLVGLNSIDFLVEDLGFHLLEINPRPGATLDIFADSDGRLFAAHIEACQGRLSAAPLALSGAGATAIVYAPADLNPMPSLDWPEWCHDRQRPGTCLHKGDPICTVSAKAETPTAARALLTERLAVFLSLLIDSASKEAAA